MKLKLINGNNRPYTTSTDLKICFYNLNSYTKDRIYKDFKLKPIVMGSMTYFKPKNAMQIVKILTWASTHSYRISYSDNASEKSTLYFHYMERPQGFYFTN